VRPWTFGRRQAVLTQIQMPARCDFALAIGANASVEFYLGGGQFRQDWVLSSAADALKKGQWHHLVGTWDGRKRRLWIDGRAVGETAVGPSAAEVRWGAPLRLGADGDGERADNFLDGDVAMPAMYERALEQSEVSARFAQQGFDAARGPRVLGCWLLSEERGARVRDASSHHRHGQIQNHATWMIGGPSFKPEVARFRRYDIWHDRRRGHALRLASDDLYDCRWQATEAWRVPPDTKPGLHVGRIAFELEGRPHLYHVTFNVRRSTRRRLARILVLCASNTWRAYSGTPFAANRPELRQVWGTGGGPELPNKPPAYNFYRAHAGGQGTYQVGTRMPWPAAGPYIRYGDKTDYSHLMRAERFLHIWLEQSGYEFDVIMDSDLHRAPDILMGYSAVVLNGHSEYWSFDMLRGLERYLKQRGNLMVLSGNSLFWRVTYNEDQSVLECRKVDAPGEQVPSARRGEAWHSHDRGRGGMLRECGFPGWKLVGLESLGWNSQGNPENFGPYTAELTDHFLFHKPEETGLRPGEKFGWAGEGKLPMANGHEFDVRLSTLAALQEKPNPQEATLPPQPPGMALLANGIIPWKNGGSAFDYFFRPIKPKTDQGGEMIYWERPGGGRVFHAGSIGAGWALLADPKFQSLLRNVLSHFGVSRVAKA